MKQIFALIPLALLAACGGAAADDEAGAKKEDPTATVRTAVAGMGSIGAQTPIYGTVEPSPGGEFSLVTPAEAVVERILAPNGTQVAAGQAIVTLKPSRASAGDLAKASSDAAASSAAYQRAQRLRAQGLASDADVETARAAAQAAQAALARFGMGTSGLTLRAPHAGVVQKLTARAGDQLAAGALLASVATGHDLQARFGVDPALARQIHPGQTLSLADPKANLTVSGVDSQPDPATHQVSLYARVPAGLALVSGQAITAALGLGHAAQGVSIPYAALLDDGGKSYVFVVRGGLAHRQDVLPGNSSGETIQIIKGIAPGDRLVIEGASGLDDGMKVREQ
ncbi:efflux RND transporter periplasmic adaptor subunit [Novosphingobium terrae]|uniref:efflux RND transporter periplasmic adaptor subunit n=1 Tax=Novosphingobium terrae TaxID=2726189 RepID=UPI00197D54C1|nr:efflux RND transporter periplasmic adaptor subunit [Novosphingobium terrae]